MGCASSQSADAASAKKTTASQPDTRASSWRDVSVTPAEPNLDTVTTTTHNGQDGLTKTPTFVAVAKTIATLSSFVEPDEVFPGFPPSHQASVAAANGETMPKRKHLLVYTVSGTPGDPDQAASEPATTAEFVAAALALLPPYVYVGAGRIDTTDDNNSTGTGTAYKVYVEFAKPLVLIVAGVADPMLIVGGISPEVSEGNLKTLMAVRKLDDFYEVNTQSL